MNATIGSHRKKSTTENMRDAETCKFHLVMYELVVRRISCHQELRGGAPTTDFITKKEEAKKKIFYNVDQYLFSSFPVERVK